MLSKFKCSMVVFGVLLCSFFIVATTQVSAATEGLYEYTESNGEITITKYLGSNGGSVEIPSEIAGNPVTAIGKEAFSFYHFTSLTLPNTLKVIGDLAFRDNDFTSIVIPNSVETIGEHAFFNGKLTSVEIPNSVTTLKASAFRKNQLTSATIPNSITVLDSYVLAENLLTSVTIPDSVKTIKDGAFWINKLTNVTIPNGVTLLDNYAFMKNELTTVQLPNTLETIKYQVFSDNKLTEVVIPSSVKTVGWEAFTNNPMEKATFQASKTSIDKNIFGGSSDNFKILGYDPSTAKNYAATNQHAFEALPGTAPDAEPPTETPSTEDTATIPTGTGSIEFNVTKHDKKTAITEALTVIIQDKAGNVYTKDTDKLTGGKFTSVETLAPGTYYATITNGNVSVTTEVKVAKKKAVAKLFWASAVADLKDDKGLIKKSGAIQGLVYNGAGDDAQLTSGATVTIVSKTTSWSVNTNANGYFSVYVPTGTYDVIVEGADTAGQNDKQNALYSKVKVVAGQAAAPLEQLNAGLTWAKEDDKKLGFSVTDSTLTAASKAFTGKAAELSTVSLVTVHGDKRVWVADVKVKKTGDFSFKVKDMEGKKVQFIVRDAAGNVYESDVKEIKK